MNRTMDIFNVQRFVRIFINDLMLLQARRILFASLGFAGLGLIVYLTNAAESTPATQDVALTTFTILLFGGGHVFTSMIYNDMHHPLERFQFLMLPCSALERFVSRYLITAPLFFVYAVVLFKVFETVANFAISVLFENPQPIPALDLGTPAFGTSVRLYFMTHVFVYAAAIWFRSYALIKLLATSSLFWMASGILMFLSIRLMFWDSFDSFFEMKPDMYFDIDLSPPFNEDGSMKGWAKALIAAFLAWVLFLAYMGLREHEVQDGL